MNQYGYVPMFWWLRIVGSLLSMAGLTACVTRGLSSRLWNDLATCLLMVNRSQTFMPWLRRMGLVWRAIILLLMETSARH